MKFFLPVLTPSRTIYSQFSKRRHILHDLFSKGQQSHICNKIWSFFLPLISVRAYVSTGGDIAKLFALSGSPVPSTCVGVMFCKWSRIKCEKV
jgi:hypothetical protein